MSNLVFAHIQSGQLLEGGEHAAINVEVAGVPISLAIPTLEVTSLLTLCINLAGQAAAVRPGEESAVLEVDGLEVGRTSSGAVIVRLESESGASLMYRLSCQQGLDLRDALTRATEAAAGDRTPPPEGTSGRTDFELADLLRLREACRDHPAALRTIDGCLALVAELDVANDTGRGPEGLAALVAAAKAHLTAGRDASSAHHAPD